MSRSDDQRSRSPGLRLLRAEVSHIYRIGRPTNFKLVQSWSMKTEEPHHGQHQDLQCQLRSRGPSGRCWPISRERKVPETAKLVGSYKVGCVYHEKKQGACDSTPTVLTVSVDTWHDKSCVLLLLKGQSSRWPGRLLLRTKIHDV